jgi:uncharacterized protein YhaN
MRITGWHIDSFGVFAGYEIRELPAGLTLFFGPNESGKSTLLGFLRFMLFGQADGAGQKNVYPPIREGRYGGRLLLECGDNLLTVDRSVDPQQTRIYLPDGTQGNQEDLDRMLAGVNPGLFESIFAFNLEELLLLKLQSEEGVKDIVYSAGTVRPPDVKSLNLVLAEEARRLFQENEPSSEIFRILDEWQRIQKTIRKARESMKAYPALLQREIELLRAREELVDQYEARLRRGNKAKSLTELWSIWEPVVQKMQSLTGNDAEATAVTEVAEHVPPAIVEANDLAKEVTRIQKSLRARKQELQTLEGDLDGSLDALTAEIENNLEFTSYHDKLKKYSAAQGEMGMVQGNLAEKISALGEGWDTEAVRAFKLSPEHQEDIRSWKLRIDTVKNEFSEAQRNQQMASERKKSAEEEIARTQEAIKTATQEEAAELKQQSAFLQQLKARIAELRRRESQIKTQETAIHFLRKKLGRMKTTPSPRPPGWLVTTVISVTALLVVCSVWRFSAGDIAAGTVILGLTALVAGAGNGIRLRRKKASENDMRIMALEQEIYETGLEQDQCKEELESIRGGIDQLAQKLALPESPTPAALDQYEFNLRKKIQRCMKKDRNEGLDVPMRKLQAAGIDEDRCGKQVKGAQKTVELLLEKWHEWTQSIGIPGTISPEALLENTEQIESAKEAVQAYDGLRVILTDLGGKVKKAETSLRALLEKAGQPVGEEVSGKGLIKAYQELVQRLGQTKERRKNLDEYRKTVSKLEGELNEARTKLQASEERREALFARAGVTNEKEFTEKLHSFQAHVNLKKEMDGLQQQITAQFGGTPEANALIEELKTGDLTRWQKEAEGAVDDCSDLQSRRDLISTELGEVKKARQAYESSLEIPELQIKLNVLRSQLAQAVTEWRVLVLTRVLLHRALKDYNRHSQPQVIQEATRYFNQITQGAYTQILLADEGEDISVVDAQKVPKRLGQLSTGTVELLYICLRLALAKVFGQNKVPLPVIMDDVLVNFDPERAKGVVELLYDFSKFHQVLLFTCHPQTRSLFEAVCQDIRVETMPKHGDGSKARETTPKVKGTVKPKARSPSRTQKVK